MGKFFHWFVLFLFLFILVGNSVRMVFTPTYMNVTDGIGPSAQLSTETQSLLRKNSVHSLLDKKDVFQLVDPNGYLITITLSEQSHMNDVKKLSQTFFSFHNFILIIFLFLLGIFIQQKKFSQLRHIFTSTFWVVNILILVCLVAVIFFWNAFFTLFHQVFFPQGNWGFPEESLIIQLFPEQFWIASAITVLLLTWIQSFLLFLFAKRKPLLLSK